MGRAFISKLSEMVGPGGIKGTFECVILFFSEVGSIIEKT